MRIMIDYARQAGWTDNVWYVRTDGVWAPVANREDVPATCPICNDVLHMGYGLGAPCGGFAVYAFCDTHGFVALNPCAEDE